MPTNRGNAKIRRSCGSGLVETVAVAILILVITLALIDLIVMVMANSINDTAAKNTARAAANQAEYRTALQAAEHSIKGMKTTGEGFITSLVLQDLVYTDKQTVQCITRMHLKLPIPIPGIGADFDFMAQDTEPIVGH